MAGLPGGLLLVDKSKTGIRVRNKNMKHVRYFLRTEEEAAKLTGSAGHYLF